MLRFVLLAACLATAARPAQAVVPGLAGPLQALAALLPQILAVIAGLFATMLSVPMWKQRFLRVLTIPRRYPVAAVLFLGVGAWGGYSVLSQTSTRMAGDAGAASLAGTWATFRGGPVRLGTADDRPLSGRPEVRWRHKEKGSQVIDFSSSPALVSGKVYVGSAQVSVFASSGAIHCFDGATGDPVWRTPTAQQVFSSPAVANGRLYCGEGLHQDSNSKLYCLDLRTGKPLWTFPTKSHVESTPAIVGDRVVFTAGDDGVYCLNAKTGKKVWQRGGMHADISPAVVGSRVYVGTGYGKYQALCLDLAKGTVLWQKPQDLAVWGPPAVLGNRVYYGLGNGDFTKSGQSPKGRVICLDTTSGNEIWRYPVPDAVLTAVALHAGKATFGCRDGKVYTLTADAGKLVWKAVAGAPVLGSPAVVSGHVYAVGGDGSVRSFTSGSGTEEWSVLKVSPAGFLASPAVAAGCLYVGTPKGELVCLAAK
jgi:outer membrane protein assembly factor BamB